MPYTEMSLPMDIPWKRMGVSKDMIDENPGNNFPPKWVPSIAVYYHEPSQEDLPPDYCDRRITYLKISCTITNYQQSAEDYSVVEKMRQIFPSDFYPFEVFLTKVTDSYPCHGSLLQVGVYPHSDDANIKLHDYPYIVSYQPQKREMYESTTESGESLSQSGTGIKLSKGTTTTNGQEDYNLDMGGMQGVSLGVLGTWGWEHHQQQMGTVNKNQTQDQKVTNVDSSREKRESQSYSTTINQLYSLLQSYHIGTNRALFFMQPRPHIQDTKFTFIRGLRRLEGIQDFFMVINRPSSVRGLCVDVALDTAHLFSKRAFSPRLVSETEVKQPENLDKTADAIGDDGVSLHELFSHDFDLVKNWNGFSAGKRLMATSYRDQGPEWISWEYVRDSIRDAGRSMDEFSLLIEAAYRVPNIMCGERMGILFDEYESFNSGTMFVRGRRLCACYASSAEGEKKETSSSSHISTCQLDKNITYEDGILGKALKQSYRPTTPNQAICQNYIVQQINDILASSIGSPKRYKDGTIPLLATKFMLKELTQLIRLAEKAGVPDASLDSVKDLEPFVKEGLGSLSKTDTIFKLAKLSTNEIAKDLTISEIESQKVHREVLINALLALDMGSIKPEKKKINPIMERIAFEMPPERFKNLMRGAYIDKSKAKK